MKYITKQGDVLDAICFEFYGAESAAVAVLQANPRLADLGAVYSAGISIALPALTIASSTAQTVRLWD